MSHVFVCLILIIDVVVSHDVYISMNDIARIHETEAVLQQILGHPLYTENETRITGDKEEDFYNPVNAFLKISRSYLKMEEVNRTLGNITRELYNFRESIGQNWTRRPAIPDADDYWGARYSLLYLQHVFQLNVSEVASGIIRLPDRSVDVAQDGLSAKECFDLGDVAMSAKWFEQAVAWFNESLNRLDLSNGKSDLSEKDVLRNLSKAHYETGNVKHAYDCYERSLENEYERTLWREILNLTTKPLQSEPTPIHHLYQYSNIARYKDLCGYRRKMDIEEASGLTCFHWKNSTPYLKLAIIKAEQLSRDPDIILFHEIASDKEIDDVVSLAKEKLIDVRPYLNLTVHNSTRYFPSQKVQLRPDHSRSVELLTQRISDVMDIALDDHSIQIVNFGISGHIEPHVDARETDGMNKKIATWQYNLNDVPFGGQSVYIETNSVAGMVKGTAVLWYNYYLNLETDLMTTHGQCPVLFGSKWIANKWIRSFGNEFRRPCGVTLDA